MAINRVKDPATGLKVATTFEKSPPPPKIIRVAIEIVCIAPIFKWGSYDNMLFLFQRWAYIRGDIEMF